MHILCVLGFGSFDCLFRAVPHGKPRLPNGGWGLFVRRPSTPYVRKGTLEPCELLGEYMRAILKELSATPRLADMAPSAKELARLADAIQQLNQMPQKAEASAKE